MAAFATFAAAEPRAVAKVKDGTWTNAHAAVTVTGAPCVRVQRKMTTATLGTTGGWVEITDDGTV